MAEIDGVAYDDVAVMYRTTAQSRAIEEALRFRGIPYQVIGGVRFYERKEIKDILATLRLLHNPADSVALERVVGNLPIGRGLGPRALEEIRTWAVTERRPMLEGFLAIAGSRRRREHPRPLWKCALRRAPGRLGDCIIARHRRGHFPHRALRCHRRSHRLRSHVRPHRGRGSRPLGQHSRAPLRTGAARRRPGLRDDRSLSGAGRPRRGRRQSRHR